MERHRWDDDDLLLGDLAEALRSVTPLSDEVARLGRGAFAWRSVDTDLMLASLSFDSSTERESSSRSAGSPRVLVFSAEPLSVELELRADQVAGQVFPPGPAEVTAEFADGSTLRADADELGFFLIPATTGGHLRLRCETPGAKLVTDWVQL